MLIKDYLKGFCRIMGEKATVEFENGSGNDINVNLKGIQSFSGQETDILKSLGYILELYVRRERKEGVRIFVDVNSYKANRRERLAKLALKVARKVAEDNKRIRLNPMKAYERKAIHVALADFSGVRTKSVGEGDQRRVIIEPSHD